MLENNIEKVQKVNCCFQNWWNLQCDKALLTRNASFSLMCGQVPAQNCKNRTQQKHLFLRTLLLFDYMFYGLHLKCIPIDIFYLFMFLCMRFTILKTSFNVTGV